MEESISQLQFSIHANFVSLSVCAWSADRLAWCTWNRWNSSSWLISWKAISCLCFPYFSPHPQLQLHTICDELFSLLEQPSQIPVQGSFLRCLSVTQWKPYVYISISFYPWHWKKKRWCNWFSVKSRTWFPGAGQPPNMTIALNFLRLGKTEKWSTAGCFEFFCCYYLLPNTVFPQSWMGSLWGCPSTWTSDRHRDSWRRRDRCSWARNLCGQVIWQIGQSPHLWRSALLWVPHRSLENVGVMDSGQKTSEAWTWHNPDGWVCRGVDFLQRHTWDVSHGVRGVTWTRKCVLWAMRGVGVYMYNTPSRSGCGVWLSAKHHF